jgi:hypothetical protein
MKEGLEMTQEIEIFMSILPWLISILVIGAVWWQFFTYKAGLNEVMLASWFFLGFYGEVKFGPRRILWILPGSEIHSDTVETRENKAIKESDRFDPPPNKPGFPIEIDIYILLRVSPKARKEGYKRFLAQRNTLEKDLYNYLRQLLDYEVRAQMEKIEKTAEEQGIEGVESYAKQKNGIQDVITSTMYDQAKLYLDEDEFKDFKGNTVKGKNLQGAIEIANISIKPDLPEDYQQVLLEPKKEELRNKQRGILQTQVLNQLNNILDAGKGKIDANYALSTSMSIAGQNPGTYKKIDVQGFQNIGRSEKDDLVEAIRELLKGKDMASIVAQIKEAIGVEDEALVKKLEQLLGGKS